jgi:hypothetical protein
MVQAEFYGHDAGETIGYLAACADWQDFVEQERRRPVYVPVDTGVRWPDRLLDRWR